MRVISIRTMVKSIPTSKQESSQVAISRGSILEIVQQERERRATDA
jgi:hypothetical protein